ncbi:MAG: Tex family protein [Lachnospirales bacterium]
MDKNNVIIDVLVKEFSIKREFIENVINLLGEGNTIPFIARYRKELTGSMDDQVLRELHDRFVYLTNLEEKRENTIKLINELELLTPEIELALIKAKTPTEIDDIYRPFRPKRRTKATIAKEKGLEPLANIIFLQETKENILEIAKEYIDIEKEVNNEEEAVSYALDIIAETISDDADIRKNIREYTFKNALIETSKNVEEDTVFDMYSEFIEKTDKIAGHRVLAINRGEKEKVLSVKLNIELEDVLRLIKSSVLKNNQSTNEYIETAILDSYKRLISPSIEREIRNDLTEVAEESGIKLFGKNLKQLLMQPPVTKVTVLALDPGFRTGCKVAVIDDFGKVLETGVVYPTVPHKKIAETIDTLSKIIDKHKVNLCAIGNGTASRETEAVVVQMIKEKTPKLQYCIVNEAGASVYSASKLGAEEFPEYDVALRSAVSIGRRLQDPMAELVKIDPKSIGVGQYQHDMNQKKLSETLGGVVEDCVNSVGVDINTASPSLLAYVSGLSKVVAKNIETYRLENGTFKSRKEILKVAKLGPKAFEQCAGFLRIRDGANPLDNTSVHPESYDIATAILKELGYATSDLFENKIKINLDKNKIIKLSESLNVGVPTINDIINELNKPGRDPREDMPKSILKSDVLDIKDLTVGMELTGTVRNVIDFGCFVDIGVHHDGLVHISELSNSFVKHPSDVVAVGDIVKVRVKDVDIKKERVALSMKGINL